MKERSLPLPADAGVVNPHGELARLGVPVTCTDIFRTAGSA